MKSSEWFSTLDDGVFVHFLISPAPHVPADHGDIKMAELLGRLDPFVSATERGDDVLVERIQWMLDQRLNEKKNVG